MFRTLLIANRGEIAVRIIRTARAMSLKTVAVYSDADRDAYHVAVADEAWHIGAAPAGESYLRGEAIIDAALRAGADAIHPGYGFLSENAAFAEACEKAGLVFVGPPAGAIRAMGLKDAAKALMEKAGVPVVPGYHGDNQEAAFLAEMAAKTGYPVLIKAVAGGGGKGMRKVEAPADFAGALAAAQREAMAAFGDGRVLIEKYVSSPRHVEIQVFADGQGHAVALHERDCSLQRRHQKVIEEAPAPGMPSGMRRAMGEAAVAAAKAVGYRGAGTVEFIADSSDGLRSDAFWFMEMNTRLQVEHPVTEAITGLDLVEWQLRVAAGEPLPLTQDQIPLDGHAVEVRLYAEDPQNSFLPSTGRLLRLRAPAHASGVRMDMGVREGDEVSMFYDPMIGKIIAHAPAREQAIGRLRHFLSAMEIAGPKTNLAFLAQVMGHDAFIAGEIDTGFIERHMDALVSRAGPDSGALALAGAVYRTLRGNELRAVQAETAEPHSPWSANDGWVLGGVRSGIAKFSCDGEPVSLELAPESGDSCAIGPDGEVRAVIGGTSLHAACVVRERGFILIHGGAAREFTPADPLDVDVAGDAGGGALKAPMPGKIIQVLAQAGAQVARGAPLIVMEAMKMEQTLLAVADGRIGSVTVVEGEQVGAGQALVLFEIP
ncbi:MAG: acetyl/propionyl/methylcrotonyl-CoA carboxylase subunit alpha [Parvibaculaceae bacterium]|nr:acetyl/propionyl/methylcrotonyl-CoA carboxylase subunit alpha [Parvibaculaceae bacterium]